jgi:hypothetical protein
MHDYTQVINGHGHWPVKQVGLEGLRALSMFEQNRPIPM